MKFEKLQQIAQTIWGSVVLLVVCATWLIITRGKDPDESRLIGMTKHGGRLEQSSLPFFMPTQIAPIKIHVIERQGIT
jgi:hypothetical protein